MEAWKSIIGYDGLYEVSDLGRIKSSDRICKARNNSTQIRKGRIIQPGIDTRGYYMVVLTSLSGERVNKLVHRLVAQHFIPNLENKYAVNHRDFNKLNCVVDNLEWATSSENNQYTINHDRSNYKKRSVVVLDEKGMIVFEFESTRAALRHLKLPTRGVKNGIEKGHKIGGYTWQYKTA